ncbi:MAG: Imm21 family immunity protein [Planctomycetota bacterium]
MAPRESLDWIQSKGGPLLLAEERLLPVWGGFASGSGHEFETDYDLACSAVEYSELIRFRGEVAVSIGDEPFSTAISRLETSTFELVAWSFADNEPAVLEHLSRRPDDLFQSAPTFDYPVHSARLVLFDSAAPGSEADSSLRLDVEPGTYRVCSKYWQPDENTGLVLHRFERRT